MFRAGVLIALAACYCLTAFAASTERRVALVIGNSKYRTVSPLKNPRNDAVLMRDSLRRAGFKVTMLRNGSRQQMLKAIIDFGEALNGGAIGLFYYSGHGIQVDGVNYMVPVNARLKRKSYAPVETVDLAQVLARMGAAGNKLNIVIMDACRNNPFPAFKKAARRGLAVTKVPDGTYIAYATAPDDFADDGAGRYSPFTQALARTISQPGLELDQVFRRVRSQVARATNNEQVPWSSHSVTGEFFFTPGKAQVGAATAADGAVWTLIKDLKDPNAFQNFLKQYPNSRYAAKAHDRFAELSKRSSQDAELLSALNKKLELAKQRRDQTKRLLDKALTTRSQYNRDQSAVAGIEVEVALLRRKLGVKSGRKAEPLVGLHFPPGSTFRDCKGCPEMVVIPPGSFMMGDPLNKKDRQYNEEPQHLVNIRYKFAVGKFEVTRGQFAQFVNATGYSVPGGCYYYKGPHGKFEKSPSRSWRNPGFSQNDRHPAVCVSWDDARAYADWLSQTSGNTYRLLSEAEWEYAARAGTKTPWIWGDNRDGGCRYANIHDQTSGRKITEWINSNCDDGIARTAQVGRYRANRFGLYDVIGNVWEWVADCSSDNYKGAPNNGSVWVQGNCRKRVIRGGSWLNDPPYLRSAMRVMDPADGRSDVTGFRVARTISR